MAFSGKGKKENLKQLVNELELARTGNETRIQLKHLMLESEDYEGEYVQSLYERECLSGASAARTCVLA